MAWFDSLYLPENTWKKITFLLSVFYASSLFGQWTNGQNAQYVIGEPDFTTYNANTFSIPIKAAIDITHGKLYIVDNNQIVVDRYSYPITGNNPSSEATFGISDNSDGQNTFIQPISIAVYNGTLWVCDATGFWIQYAYSASSAQTRRHGVLGQTNYSGSSGSTTQSTFNVLSDICIDESGNMWVCDKNNNRVLEFANVNSKPNGGNADKVIGQASFTSNGSGTTSSKLWHPTSVCVSGVDVWL